MNAFECVSRISKLLPDIRENLNAIFPFLFKISEKLLILVSMIKYVIKYKYEFV